MSTLLTFPGGQEQKDMLVAAIAADKAADRLVKGTYGNGDINREFRGCAVGCTIHALAGRNAAFNDHSAYESLIGVPRAMAELEDAIFEGLPHDEAMDWPVRFTAAIPVGVDLRPAYRRFMVWMLADPEDGLIRFADAAGRSAIERVADLHSQSSQDAAAGDAAEAAAGDAARDAAWAARDAARAARAAARAATWDATWDAAWDARAAAWAARAATWDATWDAARDAARDAAYRSFADRLILEIEATVAGAPS